MSEKSVLIVDDERMIREYFTSVLENYDLAVTSVGSGEEALTELEKAHFDLVISDIQMPGMSGVDLTRRIRETNPGIPILLITGAAPEEMIAEGTSQGTYFLRKPMSVQEIMRAVEMILNIKPPG
ncbi:MAG: hypothetical protein AUJ92_06665 [Armatimonadetes bacterium CG2_30_59_28]|nr:response regulator [Armatimonadota bacterium]OIO96128.1 MAG: hypothetical protein AUJ92_06665 [Armatimonadetes bacterium CG2_30_59_28]PIU63037.1 MAG: two-component system response regulator [Armatimonadetes bacterium CG07_land_8_20_14_0_80_59_28]PIX43755.1 MAG: two-component system response regulator [Armatimonadetes bacterium CG_4_8_14_3_um_filter_58_9]PIY48626.1 MAG: two-component system response regulator [Armatimonadetes bacterium CG_4_10_14_3_um_filter_59_10]PJB66206.1 MAG: two-compone